MVRRRPNKQQTPTDPRVAVDAADAFRLLSKPFLQKVGKDMAVAHQRAVRNLGGMIASATSLALSIELYLKALRILMGLEATTNHDLWALFKGLPDDLKKSIEAHYDTLGPPPGADIDTLELQISVGPFRDEQIADADKQAADAQEDNTLKSVLKRSKDAFQTWRYLHERGDTKRINTFRYEFHYLENVAEALRSHFFS